jgi:uncharacterized membrane protein YphA (DoxX/SURF4 family)
VSAYAPARPATVVDRWWPWVATVLRLLLAVVLAVAGALKLPDPAESVRAVRAYQLLPELVVPAIGYALPLLELALAVLLLLGLLTRWAALVTALLMAAFVVGIGSAWARGLTIECGCFGGGGLVAASQTRYLPDLIRDGGLLLAALLLVARPASRLSLGGALEGAALDGRVDDDAEERA